MTQRTLLAFSIESCALQIRRRSVARDGEPEPERKCEDRVYGDSLRRGERRLEARAKPRRDEVVEHESGRSEEERCQQQLYAAESTKDEREENAPHQQ